MIKLVVCVVLLAVFAAAVYVFRAGSADLQACAGSDESSCGSANLPTDGLAFLQRRPS